jgi:hypothetical protein
MNILRIWDIHPGYLNYAQLLAEHSELHAVSVIIRNNLKTYSYHPESSRWQGYGWALKQRHKLLVAEMRLRGLNDITPIKLRANPDKWPTLFFDEPAEQLEMLQGDYPDKGRIALPKTTQQLWAQHKYSVMARSPQTYQRLGQEVAEFKKRQGLDEMSMELTRVLRRRPKKNRLENAIEHMWGYVSEYAKKQPASSKAQLKQIQKLSIKHQISYLVNSTALSDLFVYV